mgnify:CR=1 FL=1
MTIWLRGFLRGAAANTRARRRGLFSRDVIRPSAVAKSSTFKLQASMAALNISFITGSGSYKATVVGPGEERLVADRRLPSIRLWGALAVLGCAHRFLLADLAISLSSVAQVLLRDPCYCYPGKKLDRLWQMVVYSLVPLCNLRYLGNQIGKLDNQIDVVDNRVGRLDNHVGRVGSQVGRLAVYVL